MLATPKSGGFASLDVYFTNIRQMIEKKVCTARIRFLMQVSLLPRLLYRELENGYLIYMYDK